MAAASSSGEKLRCDLHEIIHGTQLDPAVYWDTDDDDDDDCGPRPHDLYQTFTWTIDNFSNINDTVLSSDSFDVGGYKWNILIYPQGVDNASIYLSLFLSVDKHEEPLPGWSRYAQFSLCLVNKDTKKSKYSGFCNKEYDWGWKRYIDLSRLPDGFLTNDVLTITAQVQVIRERVDRPFRCLDEPYRRELSKVYMTNVDSIIQRFADERMKKISKLINDEEGAWSRLSAFWLRTDATVRQHITREKTGTILRHLVERFFVPREVTSSFLMDSLYAGLKAIKQRGKNREEMVADHAQRTVQEDDGQSFPVLLVDKDNDMFVLADDAIRLLERVALLHTGPHPPSRNGISLDNYSSKDGSTSGQESTEHHDARLVKLGWKLVDFFFISHVFSRLEAAYQEATALKHQEKHIEDMVEENIKRIGDQQL